MNHGWHLRALMLGIGGACALGSAQANEAQGVSAAAAAPVAAEAQALRAVRDKATGRLRAPDADEAAAMAEAERASRKARGLPEVAGSQPVVVVRHASGMMSAKLGPDQLTTLRGERQADGSVRRVHADGTSHDRAPAARDNRPTE
jgi:hypothetical protein